MDGTLATAIAEATPQAMPTTPMGADAATPDQAPEAQQAPAHEPQWIEAYDPDNPDRLYTKIPADPLAAGEWAINKDREYSRVKAERDVLMQQMQSMQRTSPAATPQASPVEQLAAELEAKYMVKYQGNPVEDIRAAAQRDAEVQIQAEDRAFMRMQSEMTRREVMDAQVKYPFLYEGAGAQLYNRFNPGSVADHLELYEKFVGPVSGAGSGNAGLSPQMRQSLTTMQGNRVATMRTPTGAGAAPVQAGDNATVLTAFQDFKNARPRATQAELDAALNHIRQRVNGAK